MREGIALKGIERDTKVICIHQTQYHWSTSFNRASPKSHSITTSDIMYVRHRKLRVRIEPTCMDASTIFETLATHYNGLVYLGIYFQDGEAYVYMQSKDYLSPHVVSKRLSTAEIEIKGISKYDKVQGELLDSAGRIPVVGGGVRLSRKKSTKYDNTQNIFVHGFGAESLQHVSKEYVVGLVGQKVGLDFFVKFGFKLYSLDENMNFRARKGYYFVMLLSGDGWIRLKKDEAYEKILKMLIKKASIAVEEHRDIIPGSHIEHFNEQLKKIHDLEHSCWPDHRRMYKRFGRDCLDNIGMSIKESVERMRKWRGKKLRFVEAI